MPENLNPPATHRSTVSPPPPAVTVQDAPAERAPSAPTGPRMKPWVSLLLVLALVAVFAFSVILAPRTSDEGEAFGGTDSVATQILEDRGVEPWFEPVFTPGSGEIESGLFALQAALGAGALGFALGNLRGRRVTQQ